MTLDDLMKIFNEAFWREPDHSRGGIRAVVLALRTICQTEDALIKANPLVNSQWQKGMNDAWLSAASIAREALHPFT